MKTKTVLRIIFLSATVLLLVFVFIMSAKPAEKSAEISLSVDYRLCRLLRPGFDKLTEEEQLRCAAEIDHFVRKSAHFAEFAALGALFCADFLLFDLKRYQCVIFAFLLGAAAAAADEIHQLFVPGRAFAFTDILIDSAGVLTGCLFALLIYVIIISVKKRKTQKAV